MNISSSFTDTNCGGIFMSDSNKIIKVKRNTTGAITDVMFEDGSVVPINHAILMAKDGEIEGVTVVRGKDRGEFLRIDPYDPNDPYIDDFSNFPVFKK
jgi:hypothetical protein